MSATVTCFFEGCPPCWWEPLLGEGLVSLRDWIPPLSHWSDHQSCNNPCVEPQSSPSCSSWGVVVTLSCWTVILTDVVHVLKTCRLIVSVTYYDVGSEGLSWWGLWLCPLWVEWDCQELLLWWLCLCWCCNLEWLLCELWWLELWCLWKWDYDLDTSPVSVSIMVS